jgi:hypothetical protein
MNPRDVTIAGLIALVVILSWRLVTLSRQSPCPEAPQDRDLFDYEGLGSRLNHTERESRLEKRQ